jgi:hypothetical protein
MTATLAIMFFRAAFAMTFPFKDQWEAVLGE